MSARILILEDMEADKDLMEFELQETGVTFISKWAKTEKEYLRALQDFLPDLIISDCALGQYNGASALMEARRCCPEVPFIVVTGVLDSKVDADLVREFTSRGAADFVFKDHLDRLGPAVKEILGIDAVS